MDVKMDDELLGPFRLLNSKLLSLEKQIAVIELESEPTE